MDYSKYSYQRLLEYIDKKVQQRGADIDLVQYLLTMEHAKSIEELVEIYNKTFRNLAILFYDSEDLPYNWYDVRTWGYQKDFILVELNCCFNENLLNWFKKQNGSTRELVNKCLVNLRNNNNLIEVEGEIIKSISDTDFQNGIAPIRNRFFSQLNDCISFEDYLCCVKYLVGNGRIFDIYEIEKSKAVGVVFDGLAEQYNAEMEQEKIKEENRLQQEKAKLRLQQEKEEIKRHQEKREKIINLIIAICFVLVLVFILILSPVVFLIIASVIVMVYCAINAPKEPASGFSIGDILKSGMGLFFFIAYIMRKK